MDTAVFAVTGRAAPDFERDAPRLATAACCVSPGAFGAGTRLRRPGFARPALLAAYPLGLRVGALRHRRAERDPGWSP